MKIRLHGTIEECHQAAERIAGALRVVSASDAYPDRGRSQLVRVYLDVRLDSESEHEAAPVQSRQASHQGRTPIDHP